MAQVGGKDAYRLGIGFLLALCGKLRLYGGLEQSFVAVFHGEFHLVGGIVARTQVEVRQFIEALLGIGRDVHADETLFLRAADGEQTVAGDAFQGFGNGEIVLVVLRLGLVLLAFHHFGGEDGSVGELTADGVARALIFGDTLCYDVACALQCLSCIFHVLIKIAFCHLLGVACRLLEQVLRQRRQPFLRGDIGAGLAARLVGQVDILQLGAIPAVFYASAQVVGQFALALDGGKHGLLAIGEVLQTGVLLLYAGYLHFV